MSSTKDNEKDLLAKVLYDLNIVKNNARMTQDVLERDNLSNECRLRLETELKKAKEMIAITENYLHENNLL